MAVGVSRGPLWWITRPAVWRLCKNSSVDTPTHPSFFVIPLPIVTLCMWSPSLPFNLSLAPLSPPHIFVYPSSLSHPLLLITSRAEATRAATQRASALVQSTSSSIQGLARYQHTLSANSSSSAVASHRAGEGEGGGLDGDRLGAQPSMEESLRMMSLSTRR